VFLSGSDILVKTLIEQGCDTVFGYPGGQILNVYDSLYAHQDQITHILTAHEQGAAHAADGYARTTGKVGVVISTSGPGATNLVTGIATAYLDSIPIVAICGNVPTTQIGTDSFQELDITGVTLPITKHNYFVGDVEQLADTIREAFVLAKSGRPGPVLIDVPKDVQIATCEYEPQPPVEKEPPHAAKDIRIEEAAMHIAGAKRPYIYFGGGVITANAQEEMLALAQRIHRNDTMQEILSLSERFGVHVSFSKPNKQTFLHIVHHLAEEHSIDMPEGEIDAMAERFALERGGRSARLAQQFIDGLLSR